MLRHLRLLWLLARISAQNELAYRFDFVAQAVSSVVQVGAELLGLWAIFSNTESLAGWNAWEILVLLGVFRILTGVIALCVSPNMRALMEDIRTGKLDFLLLAPVNSQFYASVRRLVFWRVSDVALGLVLVVVGAWRLSTGVSFGDAAAFVGLLACAVAIVYAIWLALGTCAFWFTKITNIEMIFWNVFEAGRYPVDIYRPWMRWAFTYLVPLAVLTTLPARALTGRGAGSALLVAAPMAVVLWVAAAWFWRRGLRSYTGASA